MKCWVVLSIALIVMIVFDGVVASEFADMRQKWLSKVPEIALLHAPFTPYLNDSVKTLNVDVVPSLAAAAAKAGVNTVWVPGSMGQFPELNLAERKALLEAWVNATQTQGLPIYLIAHVGSNCVSDSVELAEHAADLGVDAIASVPPYYGGGNSVETIVEFLEPISKAAPNLPFWYYHLPAVTHQSIAVHDLLSMAATRLPNLIGIKYVENNPSDWFNCVRDYNSTYALLFASEPKLMHFGLGLGRGVVLAEDFFAPTYIRMHREFLRGDWNAAHKEQNWKLECLSVFGKNGGQAAEREVYQRLAGVDLGPPRLPATPFVTKNKRVLEDQLEKLDFYTKGQHH